MKGHKQSLDRGNNKENLDVDMHKYKSQVIQSMQEGNKLRFVIKVYLRNEEYRLFKYFVLPDKYILLFFFFSLVYKNIK